LESKNQFLLKSEQAGLNAAFLHLDNQNLQEKNALLSEKNQFLLQKLMQQDQQRPRPTPAPDSTDVERQLRL
jgi:hypothetical protein